MVVAVLSSSSCFCVLVPMRGLVKDDCGVTPIEHAEKNCHGDVVALLSAVP